MCSFIHEGKVERGIKVALTKKQLDSSADATEMKLQPFDRVCVCVCTRSCWCECDCVYYFCISVDVGHISIDLKYTHIHTLYLYIHPYI